jgi:4-amino-4-deoxy-L-arabinose transferase-like glycosyltransferase
MIKRIFSENPKKILLLFFLFFIFIRLTAMYLYADQILMDEWYRILKNLAGENLAGENLAGKEIFATRKINGEPVPNFFMPPAYPFFIYSLQFIFGSGFLTEIVIFLQIFVSIISILFLYKILIKFFPKKICYFSTFIYAILPINIYSSVIISSSSLQLSLLTFYFYFLLETIKKINYYNLISFSVITSILILLRGEFFAFHFLSIFFLFFKKVNFKKVILSIFISLILVSPYLVRNYLTFQSISIAKAEGYDLWKGNNPYTGVEGNEDINLERNKDLKKKIENLQASKDYDLKLDNLYKDQAIQFIKEDPIRYVILYLKKFLSFAFINLSSDYPSYYNLLHIFPKLALAIGTVIGFFYLKKKDEFFIFCFIYYVATLSIFSFFFILPRYSLSVLPIQFFMISLLLSKLDVKYFKD